MQSYLNQNEKKYIYIIILELRSKHSKQMNEVGIWVSRRLAFDLFVHKLYQRERDCFPVCLQST